MVTKAEIKKNHIMEYLTDDMLDKVVPALQIIKVKAGETIFKKGDPADHFFMLKSGKVLLEQGISDDIIVTIASIDPGEAFGWAVLLDSGFHSVTAMCSESGELYMCNRDHLLQLMEENHSIGYMIMKQVSGVLKNRLDQRTDQFLRSMKTHPDIHELEETRLSS